MSKLEMLEMILGDDYLMISAAAKVLRAHKLDPDRTVFSVIGDKKWTAVIATEQAAQDAPGERRFGVLRGARGELSAEELHAALAKWKTGSSTATLRARGLAILNKAVEVFLGRSPNRDLTQYKLRLLREEPSVIVIFSDRDAQPGARGLNRKRPGFEVQLDPRTLDVQRANFTR